MKKLSIEQQEALGGGFPEECVNLLLHRAHLLLADPLYHIVFYDGSIRSCIPL